MSTELRDYEQNLREFLKNAESVEEELQAWYNSYKSIIVDPEVIISALDVLRAYNYFQNRRKNI